MITSTTNAKTTAIAIFSWLMNFYRLTGEVSRPQNAGRLDRNVRARSENGYPELGDGREL